MTTGINWASRPTVQLVGDINGGAGPSSAVDAATAWRALSAALTQADQDFHSAMKVAMGGWEGPAAEEARSALSPFAEWATAADAMANKLGAQTARHSTTFLATRAAMPSMPEVVATESVRDNLIDRAINLMTGVPTPGEVAEAKAAQQQAEAAAAMTRYDAVTSASATTVSLQPAPQLTAGVVPTTAPSAPVTYPGLGNGGSQGYVPPFTPGSSGSASTGQSTSASAGIHHVEPSPQTHPAGVVVGEPGGPGGGHGTVGNGGGQQGSGQQGSGGGGHPTTPGGSSGVGGTGSGAGTVGSGSLQAGSSGGGSAAAGAAGAAGLGAGARAGASRLLPRLTGALSGSSGAAGSAQGRGGQVGSAGAGRAPSTGAGGFGSSGRGGVGEGGARGPIGSGVSAVGAPGDTSTARPGAMTAGTAAESAGRSGSSAAGMGGGARGAGGQDDDEHAVPDYLKDLEHFTDGRVVAPPVIGADDQQ